MQKMIIQAEQHFIQIPENHTLSLSKEEIVCTDESVPLHYHNCVEIACCHEGEGTIELKNGFCQFHRGTVAIIPKYCCHAIRSLHGVSSRWNFIYADSTRLMNALCQGSQEEQEKIKRQLNKPIVIAFYDDPKIYQNMKRALDIMRSDELLSLQVSSSLLHAVLFEAVRITELHACAESESASAYCRREKDDAAGSNEYLEEALRYIRSSFTQQLKIREIADHCGISETYLRRIFVSRMNIGLKEYINRLRIAEACHQLQETDRPIDEIARHAGFSSHDAFNRNFRKEVGVTPQEWRRKPDHEANIMKRLHHLQQKEYR